MCCDLKIVWAGILLDANENALGPSLSSASSSKVNKANGHTNGDSYSQGDDDYGSLKLNRYPDPVQADIKHAFASYRNFRYGKEGTFLGVGSDEIIDLLIRVTCLPGISTGDQILGEPRFLILLKHFPHERWRVLQFARPHTACTQSAQQSTMSK